MWWLSDYSGSEEGICFGIGDALRFELRFELDGEQQQHSARLNRGDLGLIRKRPSVDWRTRFGMR